MAEATMRAQVSARRHAEEIDDFMRDLTNWEKRMKAKDAELRGGKVSKMDPLPVQRPANGDVAVGDVVKERHEPKPAPATLPNHGHGDDDLLQKKQYADQLKDKGNAYFKAGKFKEAVACYSEGMESDPRNPLLPANRAMALLKLSRFAEAEDDCDVALRLDPTYVKAYLRRGSARLSSGNVVGAEADFARALELEPSNKQAAEELAKIRALPKPASKLVRPPVSSVVVEKPGESGNLVVPVTKPVSSRSTVPLKKITVRDSQASSVSSERKVAPLVSAAEPVSGLPSEPEKPARKRTEQKGPKEPPRATANAHLGVEAATTMPTELPKTAQTFLGDWAAMAHKKDWQFEYLKRIDPSSFPSIFTDFLTSDILAEMISVLRSEPGDADKASVYPILKGLTKVPRFNIQAMFLSDEQKKVVRELLSPPNCSDVDESDRKATWDAFDL